MDTYIMKERKMFYSKEYLKFKIFDIYNNTNGVPLFTFYMILFYINLF